MIVLSDTDTLRVSLSGIPTPDVVCYVNYSDNTADTVDHTVTNLSAAGYTTVLTSPAASEKRVIKSVHIHTPGTQLIVIVAAHDGTNNRVLKYASLPIGRTLSYDSRGWFIA